MSEASLQSYIGEFLSSQSGETKMVTKRHLLIFHYKCVQSVIFSCGRVASGLWVRGQDVHPSQNVSLIQIFPYSYIYFLSSLCVLIRFFCWLDYVCYNEISLVCFLFDDVINSFCQLWKPQYNTKIQFFYLLIEIEIKTKQYNVK